MLICGSGCHAALGRTIEEAKLQEVRFDDVHDGILFLADGGGYCVQTHRSAIVFLNDRPQYAAVHIIESERINLQQVKSFFGHLRCNFPIRAHLGIIAHAP